MSETPDNTPALADVEGLSITAEAWEAMSAAERSVAAVVGAARRREFVPDDDAALVRALAVAARAEFVPRSRPFPHLNEALWSVYGTERPNGDLWGVLWDPEVHALSFVPVGAPTVRCTNLWLGAGEDGDDVVVDSNNGPAGPAPVLLWSADDEVAQGIREWCQAEPAALAEVIELRQRLAAGGDEHHTLPELYESRALLNAYAVETWKARGWEVVKSWRHADGEPCFGKGGWFIVHVRTPHGNASYHYPAEEWDSFDVPEVERAPEFDGHTTKDVHDRLRASLRYRPEAEAITGSCCRDNAAAATAVEETCGAYATPAHERNARATGDPGCPLPVGHSSSHGLSNQLIINLDKAAAAANGPAREQAVAKIREAGLDPAHYDITTGTAEFEAWRRSDAPPQDYVGRWAGAGEQWPSGLYEGE